MQIVIDIDDETYNDIKKGKIYSSFRDVPLESVNAIANGTPLPKGHGDLIDRDKIEYLKAIHDLKWGKITGKECATKIRYSAPTIIEADKEREE